MPFDRNLNRDIAARREAMLRDFAARRTEFDRSFKRTTRLVGFVWALGVVVGLSATAVILWAVVRIVQHYT